MGPLLARTPDKYSATLIAPKAVVLTAGFVERGVDACLLRPACEGADKHGRRELEKVLHLCPAVAEEGVLLEKSARRRASRATYSPQQRERTPLPSAVDGLGLALAGGGM